MPAINRRDVFRSASALVALPFATALVPSSASEQTELQSASQTSRFKLSRTAGTAVSPDLLNFVKDHSARVVATSYQGAAPDYAALGDQFHMLGKHLSLAGADKRVKAHCKKLLRTGTMPTIDAQAVAHAVSCVQAYAPSYSVKELLSSTVVPASPQDWAVQLKKLQKKGLVKYCHQAARQLKALGHASRNQPLGVAHAGAAGSYKPAAYDPTDATQAAHVLDICSLSQKEKFFICIGATVAAGLVVLAVVVAVCGATALAACFGGAVVAGISIAGFGVITGAILQACSGLLAASYHTTSRPSAALEAI